MMYPTFKPFTVAKLAVFGTLLASLSEAVCGCQKAEELQVKLTKPGSVNNYNSWNVFKIVDNENTKQHPYWVNSYSFSAGSTSETKKFRNLCLGEQYYFQIQDKLSWNGSYEIKYQGEIIFSGGNDFGSQEIFPFILPKPLDPSECQSEIEVTVLPEYETDVSWSIMDTNDELFAQGEIDWEVGLNTFTVEGLCRGFSYSFLVRSQIATATFEGSEIFSEEPNGYVRVIPFNIALPDPLVCEDEYQDKIEVELPELDGETTKWSIVSSSNGNVTAQGVTGKGFSALVGLCRGFDYYFTIETSFETFFDGSYKATLEGSELFSANGFDTSDFRPFYLPLPETASPTTTPTSSPTAGPTAGPTASPTSVPSASPSTGPTFAPTAGPTAAPSAAPSASPSTGPTSAPTFIPTSGPSASPTTEPSSAPTSKPSAVPTASPTTAPTPAPTSKPTLKCVDNQKKTFQLEIDDEVESMDCASVALEKKSVRKKLCNARALFNRKEKKIHSVCKETCGLVGKGKCKYLALEVDPKTPTQAPTIP